VIRTREAGAEKIRTRRGKMPQALTFGEKEPASGRESIRSGGVRAGDPYIRQRQGGRPLDQAASGQETLRSGSVRAGDP